jgi:hypothetical protein
MFGGESRHAEQPSHAHQRSATSRDVLVPVDRGREPRLDVDYEEK